MNIADCIHEALGDGQINDLLLSYFLENGAVSEDFNDAQVEFLLARGVEAGQVNSMWFEFLREQGYLGSLEDMYKEFWCVGGGTIGFDFCMTVGAHPTAGTFGYDLGTGTGIMEPPDFEGLAISQFTGETLLGDVILAFGPLGDEPLPGASALLVAMEGFGEIELLWNGSVYLVVDLAAAAFIESRLGLELCFDMDLVLDIPTNAVLHNGEVIEFNGEVVTHG